MAFLRWLSLHQEPTIERLPGLQQQRLRFPSSRMDSNVGLGADGTVRADDAHDAASEGFN